MIKKYINKAFQFRKTTLFKTSFWNGIATVFKLLTGLVSNKFVAIYLGPAGIALLAQFQNFIELTGYFANFGINNGMTKYVAEKRENKAEIRNYISTGFLITLIGTLLVSVTVFFGRNYFSNRLLQSEEYSYAFVIFSLTMILVTLNVFILSVLNGFKEFKIIIARNIIAALVSLVITVILVFYWGLNGALVGAVLSQIIIFFILLGVIRKADWLNIKDLLGFFSNKSLKNLAKYSLMSLSVVAFVFVQLQIRNYIIKNLSITQAGHWQALIRISSIYLLVITNTLNLYFLPRLSEIKDKLILRAEIIRGYKFIMPLTVLAGSVIFIFKAFVVKKLFSAEFLPMLPLFTFQIIGDIIKVGAWILSMTMMAQAMTYIYITTDIIFCILNYTLSVFFINKFGVIGATYSYAIHYFLYFLTLLFIFRKILFVKAVTLKGVK